MMLRRQLGGWSRIRRRIGSTKCQSSPLVPMRRCRPARFVSIPPWQHMRRSAAANANRYCCQRKTTPEYRAIWVELQAKPACRRLRAASWHSRLRRDMLNDRARSGDIAKPRVSAHAAIPPKDSRKIAHGGLVWRALGGRLVVWGRHSSTTACGETTHGQRILAARFAPGERR